jgi:hypothetical protein
VTPLVVVHDAGATGAVWREQLRDWPDADAPDLVVERASGDRTDVVWLLLEQMEASRDRAPILIGCGDHSLAAETFALAGWIGGLVLVDGLGGAWTTPDEQIEAQNAWARAKADDPDLVGYAAVWSEPFYAALRACVVCPVLVIETPTSITPEGEAERRVRQFAGPAELLRLEAPRPASVLAAVLEWWGDVTDQRR